MERHKNDVPTEIFSWGRKNILARGQEKPLKIFCQGCKKPAKNHPFCWYTQATKQVFAAGKGSLIYKVKVPDDELGKKIRSRRRSRRTTVKKWRRRLNRCHRETKNLKEQAMNSRKHAHKRMCPTQCERKRTCSTQSAQKRARQWHNQRGQITWQDMRHEQQTILRRRKRKKMRNGIASSWRQNLSGEVTDVKNKLRQGHAWKGKGSWPGMHWG